MKAVLKYPGRKWRMAKWIIDHFPEHHSYLEPFFGSGAVLFNKERSKIETVNDLDGNVVNLFQWIKNDPEKLAREIYFTPYAREIYDNAFCMKPKDSLEKAVQFYIRCNMGHGYRTNGVKVGWKNDVQGREQAYAAKDWAELPERIMEAAERLRGVQIERIPAIDLIGRFNSPKVLVYADPPYLGSTRSMHQYECEMTSGEEHEELLKVLLKHQGPVVLSGYDNELYREMLKGWHVESYANYTQAGSKREECLWMNFEPKGIARQVKLDDLM